MSAPLAQRMRPQTIDDIVGQKHLLGEGKPLRNIILSANCRTWTFTGPSGVCKNYACEYHSKDDRPAPCQIKRHDRLDSRHKGRCCKAQYLCSAQRDPALSRRDSVFQQKAAADTARIHRKRRHNAYSVNDREPVFLYLQRDSQPLDRV